MGSKDVHGAMTPIIDLGPTPRPFRYQKETRLHVAWPFWAFKVGVAIPPPRRFNVLERFVLKASLAGARRAGRIAEALQLDRELVDYLVDDLTSREYLDAELVVTERGEEALRDDEDKEPEWVTGHIFKDAVSRKLWPRFVRGPLNSCKAKMEYGRGATVTTGSEGDPDTKYPFVVWPEKTPGVSELPPWAPDPFSAGDAIRRAVRAEEQFERNIVDDDAPRGAAQTRFFATMHNLKSQAGNTRLMGDEKPRPCFVLTHVHLPENMERSASWQVCDPFGLGLSSRLRRTIRKWIEEDEADLLRENVIEEVIDGAYEVDETELSQLLMARYEEAADAIEKRFEDRLLPEAIRAKICQMEQGFRDAKKALEGKGESKDDAPRNVRAFLRAAQAGLEELFAEVLSNYLSGRKERGSASILSRLGESSRANAEMLTELAAKLGLDVDDTTQAVLVVERDRAQGVVEYGNRDLFTAFSLLVLQADDRPDHPLHQLSELFPQVASFLAELKENRDQANHASEHGIDPARHLSPTDMEGLRDKVFRVVDGLVPEGSERIHSDELARREESWDAELMCKLRAASAQKVRERVGRSLNDRPILKGRLVELVQTATELDVLAAQLDDDDHLGPAERKLQDLAFAANAACEALTKSLLDRFSTCQWSESDEHTCDLVGLAEKANFRFDPDGEHADTLLEVNPHRLRAAVEGGRGSLNALVWAALIRAETCGGGAMDLLREVAESNRRYLDDMARISAWRGHGNKMMLELDDAQDVVDTVFRQVKAILDSTQ